MLKYDMVKVLLHTEGLAFLLGSIIAYYYLGGSWLWFVILFFTPDISILGYFISKKVGGFTYNILHTYLFSLAVFFLGTFIFKNHFIALFGVILFGHIGFDRFLGFGLKYPTSFKDTHLQRV